MRPDVGNPAGAGDSAAAGLLSGLDKGLHRPARRARAMALSASPIGASTAGEFGRGAYQEPLPPVAVDGEPSVSL